MRSRRGPRRGDGDLQDGRGIRIELDDDRCLRGAGQIVRDQAEVILHFFGGDIAVLRQIELDQDERLTFGGCRTKFVNLTDGVDRVFDLLGDLGLDSFGRCARVGGDDFDGRDVDGGEQVDAEAEVREDARHDEGHDQHGGEDRPADAKLCECVHAYFAPS